MERYELVKKLRSTLYGEVHVAKDLQSGNTVAIKLSKVTEDLRSGEDPIGEIRIMEKLMQTHGSGREYILKLLDHFEADYKGAKYIWCVMEFAEQGDLLEKILGLAEHKRQMSFSKIRRCLIQIAEGLAFIHRCGFSHLDLSLENVLLSQDAVRICDFGQTKEQQQFSASPYRRGKNKYMCPEVYHCQEYDGTKADVWSFGVMFWALLTGGLLYEKPDMSDLRFRYLVHGSKGVRVLLRMYKVPDVPAPAIDLLSRMIAINPTKRYSAEQILRHPWLSSSPQLSPSKPKLEISAPKVGKTTFESPFSNQGESPLTSKSSPSGSPLLIHKTTESSSLLDSKSSPSGSPLLVPSISTQSLSISPTNSEISPLSPSAPKKSFDLETSFSRSIKIIEEEPILPSKVFAPLKKEEGTVTKPKEEGSTTRSKGAGLSLKIMYDEVPSSPRPTSPRPLGNESHFPPLTVDTKLLTPPASPRRPDSPRLRKTDSDLRTPLSPTIASSPSCVTPSETHKSFAFQPTSPRTSGKQFNRKLCIVSPGSSSGQFSPRSPLTPMAPVRLVTPSASPEKMDKKKESELPVVYSSDEDESDSSDSETMETLPYRPNWNRDLIKESLQKSSSLPAKESSSNKSPRKVFSYHH